MVTLVALVTSLTLGGTVGGPSTSETADPPSPVGGRVHRSGAEYPALPAPDIARLLATNGDPDSLIAALHAAGIVSARRYFHHIIDLAADDAARAARVLTAAGLDHRGLPSYRLAGTDARPYTATGTVFVRLARDTRIERLRALAESVGATNLRPVAARRHTYAFRVEPSRAVAVAEGLHAEPGVVWAEPDFVFPLTLHAVNDALRSYQWHLDKIGADAAWALNMGGPNSIVAILDTGVDPMHPDLAAKLVHPYNAITGALSSAPHPTAPHGTACAGLAAAMTNNGEGVAGVCPNCRVMPIAISDGPDNATSVEGLAGGITWATEHGAAVLSNSWGIGTGSPPSLIADAIGEATTQGRSGRGALVLFASGNDSQQLTTTEVASRGDVLAIGATNADDVRWGYSNFGATLDLVAPAGTATTDLRDAPGYCSGNYCDGFNGTSAATPIAAGLAGLVIAAKPELSRAQVTGVLLATAVDVGSALYPNGRTDNYGYGRIDAHAALAMTLTGVGPACATDASCGPESNCETLSSATPALAHCVIPCGTTAACPSDMRCAALRGAEKACALACTRNADCPSGFACWPDAAQPSQGACWPACTGSADCGGNTCNAHGLCGDLVPPGSTTTPTTPTTPAPPATGGTAGATPAPVCVCDTDVACDAACPCDSDCAEDTLPAGFEIVGAPSCATTRSSEAVGFVLFAWTLSMMRRARRRD